MLLRSISKTQVWSSLCFAMLGSGAFAAAGKTSSQNSALSLNELQQKCEEFRGNEQYREFNMKIECSGHYTMYEKTDKTIVLGNESNLHARTATKSGLFQTDPKSSHQATEPFTTTCSVWTKKEMRAPEGMGIPVTIKSCDQLTEGFVQNRCEEELRDFCEGNFRAQAGSKASGTVQQQDAGGAVGLCTLSTEEVVDTCAMY